MPPRDWALRISDILDAIARIQRYTSDISFDDFSADEKTVDAVVRNFGIIGEAARHVPASVRTQHADIPRSTMISMRNIVIHQYVDVSLATVWTTLEQDLRPLVPRLRAIQAEFEQQAGSDQD